MKRSLAIALGIIVLVVIYAYGFAVTQVNLEELGSPTRQIALTRIMRALAHPDFFTYDQEQIEVNVAVYVPCPSDGAPATSPDTSGPYMVVTPSCADPETDVVVEGFGFAPDSGGSLSFIPPSGVLLQIGRFETDAAGYFQSTVTLRDRTSEEPQAIRAITRRNIGNLHLSVNGIETINKIIETVFMAFLATTFGTILAIPVSFLAARNLMVMVKSPLASVALMIILAPFGFLLGLATAAAVAYISLQLAANLIAHMLALIVLPILAYLGMRWAVPQKEESAPGRFKRTMRTLVLLIIGIIVLLLMYLLGHLIIAIGLALAPLLGSLRIPGRFSCQYRRHLDPDLAAHH